jgi:hypothetical protein
MIARLIAEPFEFGKQGLSDTRACDWWRARRVALNRNQWSSVAIRGNQSQSVVIRGHPWQEHTPCPARNAHPTKLSIGAISRAPPRRARPLHGHRAAHLMTRGNSWSSVAIRGNSWQFVVISGN